MPAVFPQLDSLVPLAPDFDRVFAGRAFAPFSEAAMAFLQGVSTRLLRNPVAKVYPDVVTFAFWCRKGALEAMKERCAGREIRLGRGVVFHIAPSNVPVNFAYSLAAGLLAGNINLVRVPSRKFPQVELICNALQEELDLPEHKQLAGHIVLVRYERDVELTNFFSAHCDVRAIWGGDRTIAEIRRSPLPPRSFDLTFADRYSFCVIQAEVYLAAADPVKVAQDFYNDTYLFDQNACTAPQLVIWLGAPEQVAAAKDRFWKNLHATVAGKYQLQAISAVDKLSTAYCFAASEGSCRLVPMADNLLVRVELERLRQGLDKARSACGYFYEYTAADLDEIAPVINRKFQTLTYYGLDRSRLRQFIEVHRPCGIDRIVPLGKTLDFSLTWDGYDLIAMLSRTVSIG